MRALKIGKNITNRDLTSVDKYLQEVSKIPMISIDEEIELTNRIKSGDTIALEKLVKSNLRFVVSVAKQYQNYGLSLGDLINEGNVGLIKAAHRFDASRGFKFISYGVWWIRQCILQAISEQSRVVRLPNNKIGTINKINRTSSQLEQKYERAPSVEELSQNLEIPQEEIIDTIRTTARQVSLDEPLGDDNNKSLTDLLENTSENAPDSLLYSDSLKEDIQRALFKLSSRKAIILTLYFGLNGSQNESLEDIGIRLKLTRERVRQLKDQALKELKKAPILSAFNNHL